MLRHIFLLFIILPALKAQADFQFDIGYQYHDLQWETQNAEFDGLDMSGSDYHLGLYLRNRVGTSQKHMIGLGVNVDRLNDENLLGFRAIDYRYEVNQAIQVGAFVGAANLDSGFQQSGYYLGVNTAYYPSKHVGINFEVNYGDTLARDRVLDSDPVGDPLEDGRANRPDIFLNFYSTSVSLSFRF
jgi:hypothetical protein